jgi:hypothetical protein
MRNAKFSCGLESPEAITRPNIEILNSESMKRLIFHVHVHDVDVDVHVHVDDHVTALPMKGHCW